MDKLKAIITKAGGPGKLGAELNITSQAISQWKRVPAEHVRVLSRMADIPPELIRPDVFGDL